MTRPITVRRCRSGWTVSIHSRINEAIREGAGDHYATCATFDQARALVWEVLGIYERAKKGRNVR